MVCAILFVIAGLVVVQISFRSSPKTQAPPQLAGNSAVRSDRGQSEVVQEKIEGKKDRVKEFKRNGKITKLVWKGTELSLGMRYRDFERFVPQNLFTSVRASDGIFVVFSHDGVESKIKKDHTSYMLLFSNSLKLERITRTVHPPVPKTDRQSPLDVTATAGAPEMGLWCRIYDCPPSKSTTVSKKKERGTVEYYEFSPRGRITATISMPGTDSNLMFYRQDNTAASAPRRFEYDALWAEKTYADMNFNNKLSNAELANITYVYWKANLFVVSLTYSAADVRQLPLSLLLTNGTPSPLHQFACMKINGEWFVLNSIGDRVWFDAAAKDLR